MYCKKCGKELKETDSFCSSCGSSVEEVKNNNSSASIVFAVIAIFTIWVPIVCIPCAIVAIITGKKNDNKGGMVVGIVSLILSLLFTLIIVLMVLFAFFVASSDQAKDVHKYVEEFSDNFDDFKEHFSEGVDLKGHSFTGSDGTLLVLNSDNSYVWYGTNRETDYSMGDYEVYNGMEAVNYIVENFSKFGLSFDKQMKGFDDDKYQISNYYLLVLDCNKMVVDGKDSSDKKDSYVYYGFYNDSSLKLIDMETGENKNFILKDDNNKNNGTV